MQPSPIGATELPLAPRDRFGNPAMLVILQIHFLQMTARHGRDNAATFG
jgi:hypothetical protein